MDSLAARDNVICVTPLLTRHQADQDFMAQTPVSSLLSGMHVLELGHFVAAPFATRLLADLGADVIKIEPPGGDPVREWGEQIDGHSLWWSMHGRNKRSVVVDLKTPAGRQAVLSIAKQCDAVVENYRPGGLAKLGLSDETLRSENPRLVIAHVSGYGQDGPYRDRAAFGVIGEAVGGLRYLTDRAEPDASPPVRVGISIGDSIAGIYAAFGVVAALWSRDRGDGPGRTVDVALTESILSLMEGMLPEYGRLGKIKRPTGSAIATAAPSNAYPSSDGEWVLIAANSEPLFTKLSQVVGHPEWIEDPRFSGNQARVLNAQELDAGIRAWTLQYKTEEIVRILGEGDIPNSKIFTAADCATDPQYRDRGAVREVEDERLGAVLHAGVFPHIPECPGEIRWCGPAVGQHTEQVLREFGIA
jgi:crotonobetainyl-CoA:carnitine CoA-transferase CaiB-like acyl-CoA transferase